MIPVRRLVRPAKPWGDVPANVDPGLRIRLAGCQNHDHLAAFELRFRLDLGDLGRLVANPLEKLHAEMLVRHFAATEAERQLDLVALFEEALDGLHLDLVIVVIDGGAHLDLFDLDDLLVLASLVGLLLGLIFEAAEIKDLADRRLGIRRDLDEVEACFLGSSQRILNRGDANILAVFTDQLNFTDTTNFAVDTRPILSGFLRFERTANGGSLL